MRKLILLLLLGSVMCFSCRRTGLKKYYTRISPEEFASYDSVTKAVTSKYGIIYHASTPVDSKLGKASVSLHFLVFKKYTGTNSSDLFKLDVDAEVKNDTTLIFWGNPLEISGDTINWVAGKWFYQKTADGSSVFKVDSMPANLPKIAVQKLTMGVYQYKNKQLVKICDTQSEDTFYELNLSGFFYLPNPGRFYTLANFKQIE